MLKSYTLRPEYKDTLSGGTVSTGVNGRTIDIVEELDKGNGEIVSDDSTVQSVLEQQWGEFGRVFDVSYVQGDERIPAQEQEVVTAGTVAGEPLAPTTPVQSAADLPPAEHGDQSDYATFSVEELKSTLDERGVGYKANAKQEELVAALEADDKTRLEGAGSGS